MSAPDIDPDLLAWADRARDDGDQPEPLFPIPDDEEAPPCGSGSA